MPELDRTRNRSIPALSLYLWTASFIAVALTALLAACGPGQEAGSRVTGTLERAALGLPTLAFASPSEYGAPGNENVRCVGWVGTYFDWNTHGAETQRAVGQGKIPLIYFYIAAASSGLKDCNVGAPPEQTLCHGGAAYLRGNIDRIASMHGSFAGQLASAAGGKPALVHVEPDWYQYISGEQTAPLSVWEAGAYMNRILEAISRSCPSCQIVADISPWAHDLGQWFGSWDLSRVSYGGLVGKRFPPQGVDGKSYASMSAALGRPLIIADAWGAGGVYLGHDYAWDDFGTLDSAVANGLAVLMQPNSDPGHYRAVINSYRAHSPAGGTLAGGTCYRYCPRGWFDDSDGDGWGWADSQSCVVKTSPADTSAPCSP